MENPYFVLLSGFIGALIGSISSLTGIWIQSYFQNKHERIRLSTQMALEDYKIDCERILRKGGTVPPIVAYVHYHYELMDLLEGHKLTEESVRILRQKNKKVLEAIDQYCKENKIDKNSGDTHRNSN